MQHLTKLAQKGLYEAETSEVLAVALELWFGETTLDPSEFSVLGTHERAVAGYLLDRLSRFNCVPLGRKRQCQSVSQTLFKELQPTASSCAGVEPLARHWGLNADLKQFRGTLLPYQTRDYQRRMRSTDSAA